MEVVGRTLVAAALVLLALAVGHRAVKICGVSEDGLMACQPAVTKGPKPAEPSEQCCQALSAADLKCLCGYKNSPVLPSLGIDPDLALALPAKCGLTPPSNC
ncbi:hypothetical protein NMG60_11014316 [Bertholletia excelsa]